MSFTETFARGLFAVCIAAAGIGVSAQVPVTGVEGGATLKDIEETSTLVTVVIKGTEATDANCRVIEVSPDYFAVLSSDGLRNAYLYEDVIEVRVQGGKVEQTNFRLSEDAALSDEELETFNRAMTKARDIFDRAIANQSIRMEAATLIGLEADEDGLVYLQRLAESNDLLTAVRAQLQLYLVGDKQVPEEFIRAGLTSGDRRVRAETIILVGVLGLQEYEDRLLDMAQERLADIAAPAAFALGRLESREAVPALLDMVVALNEYKAEAAKDALVAIGGEDVVTGLKKLLPNTNGVARFRLMESLHRLNDPLGERLLKDEAMKTPSLSIRAAMALARTGDFDAREKLEEKLNENVEETPEQLKLQADIAAVLIANGDRRHYGVIQRLLQAETPEVQRAALTKIAMLGQRGLMEFAVPSLSDSDDSIAILASKAIVACAKPQFQERIESLQILDR